MTATPIRVARERDEPSRTLAPYCPPSDWPKPHAAPITYRRYHIQLDGSDACWTVVLGRTLWAANWPALRDAIDAELGFKAMPQLLKLTADEQRFGSVG
jgi:hypothetical protein